MELPDGEASTRDSKSLGGVRSSLREAGTLVVTLVPPSVPGSKARTVSRSEDLDNEDDDDEYMGRLSELLMLGSSAATGVSAWLGALTPSISLEICESGRKGWRGFSDARRP